MISGTFQLTVNIIPQNQIKVRKYLHAFLPAFIKKQTFHYLIPRRQEAARNCQNKKHRFSFDFSLTFHYLYIR